MKWLWVIIIFVVALGGWGFWKIASAPAPGQKVADLGRDHATEEIVAKTTYNSNPPTSGPHLPTWVKPGIYTTPQSEGELIHSLEHGYVIISYNCGAHISFIQPVFAHEDDPEATDSAITNNPACGELQTKLESLAKRKKLFKLIVVPRPELDTTIALTAWGAIDKFDPDPIGVDENRIERFIDYYRDHGPEKTME